ncbi:DUF6895 family protein [Kitasatospora sp. NPDC058032]|uniref:DUF6895 family protein n=1 Tax=Kitasatospora sp. NPDC058032 TaxID=3346307 RepID=UPI0036D7A009
MGTRPAGPDLAAVASLSAGARSWIGRHCGYLDGPSGRAELPVTPRVKALLQLALLHRAWAKADPADPELAGVAATVDRVWRHPGHPPLLTADPRYARQFQLMYGALAPAGLAADGPHRTALAEAVAGDFLTPRRKSPYLRLETRYYAELAAVPHRLGGYPELYRISRLALHTDERPLADLDVCNVTHTVFHLADFGFRDPGLGAADLAHARDRVVRLTERCVRRGEWDLTGKLVLAQYCLGLDPLGTPSGAAGLRMLAEVQAPDGAVPGRSAADRAPAGASPVEYFRASYQSTLVVALAAVVLLHRRQAVPALGGAR